MPQREADLPEGTDKIINGATETNPVILEEDAQQKTAFSGFRTQVRDTTLSLRQQAGDRARAYAVDGKDKATGILDNFAQVVAEAASSVDDKLGAEYGQYAHRAAEAVRSFTDSVRDKDVDQLYDDARELVRKSPAVAVGIAAVLGFALVRLAKAGVEGSSDEGTRRKPSGRKKSGEA